MEILNAAGVIAAIVSSAWAAVYSWRTRRRAEQVMLNTQMHASVASVAAAVEAERRIASRLLSAVESSATRRYVVDVGERFDETSEDVASKITEANYYLGANSWSESSRLLTQLIATRDHAHTLVAAVHHGYLSRCDTERQAKERRADKQALLTIRTDRNEYGAKLGPDDPIRAQLERAKLAFGVEVAEAMNAIIYTVRAEYPLPGRTAGNAANFVTNERLLPRRAPSDIC